MFCYNYKISNYTYNDSKIDYVVCTFLQVPAGQASYLMMPIVAKIDKGEIVVRITTYNMRRYDYNEVTIKVVVRLRY